MKILKKDELSRRNQVDRTKTERRILENIRHPCIVRLRYAFQTRTKLYMVLDYIPGGELFFHLQKVGRFPEEQAKFYAANIILGLEHLHRHNIIYRDLKPENILIDAKGYAVITDFGLSKENMCNNGFTKSFCGTPEYVAPEIINKSGHRYSVDWWSLGVLIFEMLTGSPAFYANEREKLFHNIKYAELKCPSHLSNQSKDLLTKLLTKDPSQRLGGGVADAEEIKSHPWFSSIDWNALINKQIKPKYIPLITSPTDVRNFDKEFTSLDPFDTGALSLSDDQMSFGKEWEGFTFEGENMYFD